MIGGYLLGLLGSKSVPDTPSVDDESLLEKFKDILGAPLHRTGPVRQ